MPAFADHASETQSLVRSANDLFGVNAASLRALADALRAVGVSTWATRGRSPSLAGLSTVRRTWTSACSGYGAAPCVRTTRSSASGTSCSPGCGGSAASGWWAAPGRRKILVFGNHELGVAGVAVPGFDEIYSVLYADGDPPLLMTHFPLRRVPKECVNVHGHLHSAKVRGSTRHINVWRSNSRPTAGHPEEDHASGTVGRVTPTSVPRASLPCRRFTTK